MTNYKLLCAQLEALTEGVPHEVANLANASALIWQNLKDINWAGFYKMEKGIQISKNNRAILIDKNVTLEKKLEIFKEAKQLRSEGVTVTIQPMRKNIKQQIEKLEAEGYTNFQKVYND